MQLLALVCPRYGGGFLKVRLILVQQGNNIFIVGKKKKDYLSLYTFRGIFIVKYKCGEFSKYFQY